MNMRLAAITTAATLCVITGCEDQGPFERAGEEVDEAIEDVRNGGETAGNRADDVIDDVRDELDDAADAVEEQVD